MEDNGTNAVGGALQFSQLPTERQAEYRKAASQMVRLAQACAIPIIFAPPLSAGGTPNGATGCVLELGDATFVVTAAHVLSGYEDGIQAGQTLNWQVGALPPFDPLSRVAWRDNATDIVFLALSATEARVACGNSSHIVSASSGWPPPCPQVEQLVLVSGYPKILREVESSGRIGAGPYSAMFRVTSVGEGYFNCQIEQRDLVSFDETALPPPDTDMGG
jgi:hypothetical protein